MNILVYVRGRIQGDVKNITSVPLGTGTQTIHLEAA